MDPQQQPVPTTPPNPTPTPVTPPSAKGSNTLVLVLGGIIVLLIALIAGYFLMNQKATVSETAITPTPTSTQSVAITPSMAPMESKATWATYTSTKLEGVSFVPYSIQYPPSTWTPKAAHTAVTDTYTLSKDNFQIMIYQAPVGGGGCVFEGELPQGPVQDLRKTTFTEVDTASGVMLRRFIQTTPTPLITTYSFCGSTDGKTWGSPTQFGAISYVVPTTATPDQLLELDSILKTLQEVK